MLDEAQRNHLIDKSYSSLVLRLLVDAQGDVQRGTLVDLHANQVGQFRYLDELPDLIRAWLKVQPWPA